jgi:hypothetical protein
MKQFDQFWFIQMVSQTMVFIARRFLIFAALQFVVITRYYASLCLAKNKNQRTLIPIQLRFLGLKSRPASCERYPPPRLSDYCIMRVLSEAGLWLSLNNIQHDDVSP